MARRVNTKFVIILSAALIGAAGIAGGAWIYRSIRQQNPELARQRGEEAEKKGDLKAAFANFYRAASLLSQKHQSGADATFAYSADLAMKVSRDAKSEEDAVRYFQYAMDCYNKALQENPRNVEVSQKLLEEDYQNAQYFPAVLHWKALEEVATKLITNQDAGKPRLYRAEARLRQAQESLNTITPRQLADLDEDLTAARKFLPQSGAAVALRAEFLWLQARISVARRHLTKPEEFATDEQYLRDVAAVRGMLVNCLEGKLDDPPTPGWAWLTHISLANADADVAAALATMSIDQFRLSGGRDRSRIDAAITLLDAAFAADPTKTNLADGLGRLYMATGRPEAAEGLYQRIIQRTPDNPEAYYRLAVYYRDTGQTAKAIDAYTDVTRRRQIGVGREAIRNADFQTQAVEGLAWLNMDLAERTGATTDEGKVRLKDARDSIERLRVSHAPAGMVNLLDGRMLLINKDIPNAVATLRLAEANLNGAPALAERLRQTKLMLARVNEEERQLGAALDYVNQALELRSDLAVLIKKGQLLLSLRRYDEARVLMERILGGPPGKAVNENNLPSAIAEAATNLWLLANVPGNPAALPLLGSDRSALLKFDNEDYEGAAADAEIALGKSDVSPDLAVRLYQVAIVSNVQIKHADIAKALAARALEKFPDNPTFQVIKAQLDDPDAANTPEGAKKIIEGITDDYVKMLSYATLYQRQKLWDDAIATLQKGRGSYQSAATASSDARDKFSSLLDRLFSVALAAADNSTGAKQEEYWKLAQATVTDLEKLNKDGTGGLIYRGRLEMARTKGEKGLQFFQQAVAQRPDYAYAHQMLGQAYYGLAALKAREGSAATTTYTTSALEEFRQVLRLAPNNLASIQFAIDLLWRKGDSASIKEAKGLVQSGLALAPRNSTFINYQRSLLDDVDGAIENREAILKSRPDDRDNLRLLAALYVNKKDQEADLDKKQRAMDRAIALLESDYQSHKDDLGAGDALARRLVEYDKTDKGVSRAIDIYGSFIASTDKAVRFNALVAKAEFFRNLLLRPDAIQALAAAKRIGHNDLREEAADILQQAIADEPADQDDAERHLADMYFDLGRMADAEKSYLGILANKKTPSATDRVSRRLIEAQLRQGKFQEAAPRLEELLRKQPQDLQGLILRAYASIQQGAGRTLENQQKALKAALVDLDKVLALDAGNSEALLYRASAQIMLGDRVEEAEKDLILASRQERTTLNARILLAQLYVRSQRYEEAVREYQGIVKLRPDLIALRVEYVNFLKNLAVLELSLPKDSTVPFVKSLRLVEPLRKYMDEVETAADLYKTDPRWWLLRAQGFELQGRNSDAQSWFKNLYEQLLKQNVIDAQVADAYLGSLLRSRNYDEVVKISTHIIDGSSDFISKNPEYVTFYLRRAAAYQGLKKTAEAVQDVDRGFDVGVKAAVQSKTYGPFVAVLNEVSTAPLVQDTASQPASVLSPELVAERLRVRIAKDPNETISKIGLIQTLLVLNQPAEALQVVDTLNTAESDPTLRALVLRQSALVRCENKQYAAAEKDFKELELLLPNSAENLNNYAFMLADGIKRPKDAITYAQRALKLLATRADPTTVSSTLASVYDTLGWAYYLNNELENAITNLRSSVKVQPQPAAFLHLALALQKAGKKDEALQNCQEGIKMATARRDTETLAALKDLQSKLTTP